MKRMVIAVLALCAMVAIALPAQTFTTLHSFDGPDGELPIQGLVQATDGNLYGTTVGGGVNQRGGTVFQITPVSGTLATLYSFCSQTGCADGKLPYAPLIQAPNGDFYGTTYRGGANNLGTVFKIDATGERTTVYNFCPQSGCSDGAYPEGTLVQYGGDFYGTTSGGGANSVSGTVFKITPNGTLTRLYSFCSQTGCIDGTQPGAGLVQGVDGNFYGTTPTGGANDNAAVYRITPSGTLTTLHSFCHQTACADGSYPNGGLVPATDGDLYGTTTFGGTCALSSGCGTIFKITPGGALTTLYSFCSLSGCTDGETPDAALVQATDGNFYGTTNYGGAIVSGCSSGNGCGTVFSLSVGLGPFVKTLPASGKVGAAVRILGTYLTGATGVSFNDISAVFTVVSKSEITTTVPAGATSGTVQVVTPSGTLSGNVAFRVLP